ANPAPIDLKLGLDTLREEVTVKARATVDGAVGARAKVEQLGASVMQAAPLAGDRVQDALPLIPGVVRGPDGLLNINGTRSNQSALSFNNVNGTDPVTGDDAIELPIDAVSTVQVRGSAYAPEFGLSSGAVTLVETQRAGDSWNTIVNDLEPRPRRRGGEFRGIESWTPRVTVGGPIVAGRVSVLESAQYEYSQTPVFGLPPFESDTKLQSFESYTRGDVMIDRAQRLTVSAMFSPRKTTYAGLDTFNPQSVTANVANHNTLASVADQWIVGDRGVLESQVSVKRFDSTIGPASGGGAMQLAPDRNGGSYFNSQDRASRRAEWFTTYSTTPFGPAHVIKIGGGVSYESVDGYSRSRPVDIVGADGGLLQEIAFTGSGVLDRSRVALRGFAQDGWTVGSRLTLQYGARYDYESTIGDVDLSPRGSFALVASGDGRTVVRGGGGVFFNALPLNVIAFDEMQTRVVSGRPLPNVAAPGLRAPRSINWNVEADREWIPNLFVRVGYQQRDQRFDPIVDAGESAIVLRGDGRSRYREAQVTARYQFHGADQVVASYTRSRATGDLNDFNAFFGNIENPVIRPDESGPLPWDAPHRVLLWAHVTLPRGFAIFPVLDTRTGFPLSNTDAERNFVGGSNAAGRFPAFLSIDTQITKRLVVFGH